MPSRHLSRRTVLAGALGASAAAGPAPPRLPGGEEGHQPPAVDPQDLCGADQQGHRGERPALGAEARRRGDRRVLHLRGHADQVRGGHREQQHARRGPARDGRARALRRHGPAPRPHVLLEADRGPGGQGARQRGAGHHDRRQGLLDPVVRHGRLLVRVARRVREGQGEAAQHLRGGQGSGAGADPAQGQLLRDGAELEPHRRRLRRHAEPDVLLRRGLGGQGRQVQVHQDPRRCRRP